MNKKLRKAKNQLIKDLILESAKEIIEKDGFDSLSIRKLAKKVGYSPANIYQYYDSKSEIISAVVQLGYHNIIKSIQNEKNDFKTSEEEIRYKFKKYINSALKNQHYYKAVMLSQEDDILAVTSILNNEDQNNSSAFNFLENLIEKGQNQGEFKTGNPKIKAKIIWTATFGLIIRLIIEGIDNQEIQNQLIENHFEIIFAGIRSK